MALYVFGQDGINEVDETTFSEVGLHERRDLQRLLREHIEVIASDTLIISEEFGEWEESRRRIDLLGIDKAANLVVIELKRTEDGGHMDLQAIRYAAMVSKMTFDRATEIFGEYLKRIGKEGQSSESPDPRGIILKFLDWDEPDEDQFAQDVRIVLASAEFSRELTSSVLWLNEHDLDIRCVRLKPYKLDGRTLVDAQEIIPLPEVEGYQVRMREKAEKEREARTSGADFTRFDVQIDGETHPAMWKRDAIFLICKRICEKGISTGEIATLFDWRPTRVWYSVDGTVDSAEFRRIASEQSASGGPHFDHRRWFCDPGELLQVNGKTYAFSSQWGGESWHKAMNLLKEKYPQFKIGFSAAS